MARGQATRRSTRGAPTSKTNSVPAPVGGVNAVDSIAAMPATDALILDNFFPQPTYASLRSGYVRHATGLPSWAETLMGYSNLTTTEKLFAISGTAVYDCTATGAVGTAVVTGLTNARWEYTNISVPGGAWLYAANAVDKPLAYNGTTWTKVDAASTPAITGVTTTTLRNPIIWGSRLWFVQDNTNLAWYLPVQSIGGVALSFDLSAQFPRGGSLQTILTFSLASTNEFDDYIGFLSTEGDLVVYQGSDPSTAGDFTRLGRYAIGKPIGRRNWFKLGADAVILCADGAVSVAKLIAVGIQQPETTTITYKILNLINDDVQMYANNFGWEGVVYPLGNKIIINVPENTNSRMHQFVQNTINGSWCTFGLINSPWNAATFCSLGNNLYYGGNGFVAQADTGQSDSSAQIFGSMKPAFSYVGTDHQKRFTMVRPLIQTTGNVIPALALNVDFNNVLPTTTPTFSTTQDALWNVALWNVSYWSTGPTIQKNWQTVYGVGFSATVYMTIASTVSQVNVLSFDYLLEAGGGVL